jgi:hypothetical protein
LAGLADASGRGRKPFLSEETRAQILTQATRPPKGQTRHSVRFDGSYGSSVRRHRSCAVASQRH